MVMGLMAIVERRDEGGPFDDDEVVVRVKAPFAQRRGPTISVALCSRHAVASRRVSHVQTCHTFSVSITTALDRSLLLFAFSESKSVYC